MALEGGCRVMHGQLCHHVQAPGSKKVKVHRFLGFGLELVKLAGKALEKTLANPITQQTTTGEPQWPANRSFFKILF
jgi:hypothetical protein